MEIKIRREETKRNTSRKQPQRGEVEWYRCNNDKWWKDLGDGLQERETNDRKKGNRNNQEEYRR